MPTTMRSTPISTTVTTTSRMPTLTWTTKATGTTTTTHGEASTMSLIESLKHQLRSISTSVLTLGDTGPLVSLQEEQSGDTQQDQLEMYSNVEQNDSRSVTNFNINMTSGIQNLGVPIESAAAVTGGTTAIDTTHRSEPTTTRTTGKHGETTNTIQTSSGPVKLSRDMTRDRKSSKLAQSTRTTTETTTVTEPLHLLDISTTKDVSRQDLQPELPRSYGSRQWNNVANNEIQQQTSINIKQTQVNVDNGELPAEAATKAHGDEPVGKNTIDPGKLKAGHYHEINPGQYHEVNPGQYLETNPGQYHEVNPGQYHEINPGQDYEVDNYEVDVNRKGDARIYNIETKVGDFIVGEVGRIDKGQTSEGVRYTALSDVLDDLDIAGILEHFGFGKRISRR